MMNKVFSLIIIISVIVGTACGNGDMLTNSLLNDPPQAVELLLFMLGGMCLWGGLMRIAEKAGITEYFALIFRPLGRLIFCGLDMNGRAFRLICMNVAANMLGLGNAATPIGIEAMRELEAENIRSGGDPAKASDHMVTFTVLNTASLTLIPTSCAALRARHGAAAPMDILLPALFTAVCALSAALAADKLFSIFSRRKKG